MNISEDKNNQKPNWQDSIWVLAVAGEAGLLIAMPVVLGLFLGYLLDQRLGTVFLFAFLFTLAGFVGGISLVYHWVKTTVKKRLEEMKKEE